MLPGNKKFTPLFFDLACGLVRYKCRLRKYELKGFQVLEFLA